MKGKLFFALENHEKPVSSNQQLQKLEKFAVGDVWCLHKCKACFGTR